MTVLPMEVEQQQPRYRYLLCDLLTDQPVAALPLSRVSFERRISRKGPLSGTLQVADEHTARLARTLRAYAGRSALWVLRDEQLWWGGIPWTVRAKQGQRGSVDVSVQASTFDSYADHRVLRESLDFTQVDQGAIIPELWRHLQRDPRGNIGMVADDQPTGVLRDRSYVGSDLATYGKRIKQLGDVRGGPEHTVRVYVDGEGNRVKELVVANELGGDAQPVVFSRARRGGGRVVAWEDDTEAVDGGTVFQTRGDSKQGNVGAAKEPRLSELQYATGLLDAGWPLLDVTADHTDVQEQDTLDEYAEALLDYYAGAPRTMGYDVQVGNSGWSPNDLGRRVRLKLADLWHDPPVDLTVRPVGCKVRAADRSSAETVTLILGEDGD